MRPAFPAACSAARVVSATCVSFGRTFDSAANGRSRTDVNGTNGTLVSQLTGFKIVGSPGQPDGAQQKYEDEAKETDKNARGERHDLGLAN
jgi:hypothetical protein